MNDFDIKKYIEMAVRRKYWIVIPFLAAILVGLGYLLITPKVYEASTLILVQSQRVPEEFVQSIVSTTIDDRLRTITQQVTSRTNLESIIDDYDLYNSDERGMMLDQKVALLRQMIEIDVTRGNGRNSETNAFTISYQGENPRIVMQVTNALASNFISENLKIRESQALGTSDFLSDELESITKRLSEKEEQLKVYRLKYMGALPDQLDTNLNVLSQLQMQQEQLSSSLNDAENRKLIIQQQVADSEMLERQRAEAAARSSQVTGMTPQVQNSRQADLDELRRNLSSMESRYTENHPDVKRIKQMIADLENEILNPENEQEQISPGGNASASGGPDSLRTMQSNILSTQLQQVELEIANTRNEIKDVRARVALYQKRVEDTPKREQELISLNRDYENLKELYSSMLNRKLEAEIAVSMEKKQKGEQFRVIDPAKLPQIPVSPDKKKILLMTLALGLGIGCGLAYLMEMMDTSIKEPDDLEKVLQLPVLVSLPFRYTEKELKQRKIKEVIIAASVAVCFIAAVFGVFIAAKGVDGTLDFFKGIFMNA